MSRLCFSTLAIVVLLTLVNTANSAPTEKSTDFNVGGKEGWHVPDNNDTTFYTRWAADVRLHVGDSLSFMYHNDSVLVVDKYAYYHCNTSNPIYIFRDKAKTLIKLDKPGPFYFISGTPDHCNNGQRLEVNVMSDSPPRPTPSSAEFTSATITVVVLAFVAVGLAFHY